MKAVAVLLLVGIAMASAASVTPKLTYKQALKAKSIQCDICTFIVTEIDNLLLSGATIDAIIEQVEKLCGSLDGIFPGAGASCNAIVETYLPQIIQGLVENQLSPASVCGALTLCPASARLL